MSKYKKISKNIQQVIIDNPKTNNKSLIWLNITNAGKEEMEYLRKKYNFNLNHLRASSAKAFAQRPSIEQGSGYLFLILHFPAIQNNQIIAKEIDFFISGEYLVTIHGGKVGALDDCFNLCKKDEDSFLAYEYESSAILLYEVLEKLMLDCYALLDQSSIEISRIEDIIFAHEQKQVVSKILALRHNIINFRKIMQSHKNIIKKLMEMKSSVAKTPDINAYYKELIEHTKTIWEILENQKETVEVLYQTNESLLSYKISDIMKTLTIFSVIVFPLTLLAAIFGMNVTNGMPFLAVKNGFWLIMAVMLTGSLGMLLFFEKKKWL
jgi:magnesium transporter